MSLSCHLSGLPRRSFLRQLDDCIGVGDFESTSKWCKTYQSLCSEIGVTLAPSDGDKAFTPQTEGTILGTFFSIPSWTWALGEKKKKKVLNLLFDVLEKDWITGKSLQSLLGKLTYYRTLFKGTHERGFFLEALRNLPMTSSRGGRVPIRDGRAKVICTSNLKSQSAWWIRRILSAEAAGDLPIPLHFDPMPTHHISLFPDASGGGTKSFRNGIGCVFDVFPRVFSFCLYPDIIRLGIPTRLGHLLSNKLTFLESCAALLGITMCPELLFNNTIYIYSDNAGLVNAFQKGNCRCMYTYSVILAIRAIARSLNSKVNIVKIRRCSNNLSTTADLLSKGKLNEALELMEDGVYGKYSSSFISWLSNPFPTRGLGMAIIMEMKKRINIPVFETEWEEEYIPLVKINNM